VLGQAVFEEILFRAAHVSEHLPPPSLCDQHQKNIG
jgi:hypothetical protein